MRRLSSVDATMIYLESPRNYMHTLKIARLDPSAEPEGFDFGTYRARLLEVLHRAPPFRWRLAETPLGLHHPVWIEDPDFDIDYHLRHVACPPPGDERALCDLISRIYAWPLDPSRPLWVAWIIEGLEGGEVATVFLVHHAYCDGVGAGILLQRLASLEPDGEVPGPEQEWVPEPWPPAWKRLAWGLRDLPATLRAVWPRAIRGLWKRRGVRAGLLADGKQLPPQPQQAPRTPLSQSLSPGRTYVCRALPLDDFKRIRKAFGVTINDVFLACAAGAVRRLLVEQGFDPDREPLVAQVPLSRRPPEAMDGLGNFVAADYLWLRTDIGDPLERLRKCHESAVAMKEHFQAAEGSDLVSILALLPPHAMRLLSRLLGRQATKSGTGLSGNVILSNVPGPPQTLYFGKTRLTNWFSMGQIFDGCTLNITVWSYDGRINLNVLADSRVIPDAWPLVDAFGDALAELLDKAGPEQRANPTAPGVGGR